MDNEGKHLLVIADGAAFGSEMGELFLYMQKHPEVSLYFEKVTEIQAFLLPTENSFK